MAPDKLPLRLLISEDDGFLVSSVKHPKVIR